MAMWHTPAMRKAILSGLRFYNDGNKVGLDMDTTRLWLIRTTGIQPGNDWAKRIKASVTAPTTPKED